MVTYRHEFEVWYNEKCIYIYYISYIIVLTRYGEVFFGHGNARGVDGGEEQSIYGSGDEDDHCPVSEHEEQHHRQTTPTLNKKINH